MQPSKKLIRVHCNFDGENISNNILSFRLLSFDFVRQVMSKVINIDKLSFCKRFFLLNHYWTRGSREFYSNKIQFQELYFLRHLISYRPDLSPNRLRKVEIASLDYCAVRSKDVLQGSYGRFLESLLLVY